jgi:hypothetical protein
LNFKVYFWLLFVGIFVLPNGLIGSAFALSAPTQFESVPSEFYDDESRRVLVTAFRWNCEAANIQGFQLEVSTNGNDFTLHAKLAPGARYFEGYEIPWNHNAWVRLRAFNSLETSPYSTALKVTGVVPPVGLSVACPNAGSVVISWRPSASGTTGYQVQRDTNSGFASPAQKFFLLPGRNNVSYTNKDSFETNTVYYYRVLSICPAGLSAAYEKPRPYAEVIPNGPPLAPTFVAAHTTAVTTGGLVSTQLRIIFDGASGTERGWRLERSSDSTHWVNIPVRYTGEQRNVVFDDNLRPNTHYHYRLAASNAQGLSKYLTFERHTPGSPPPGNKVWYIDNEATGNCDGSSWSNAWTGLGGINWAALGPGHTVYISGGKTNKTYQDFLVTAADGAYHQPITFKTATNAPHNGRVIFRGGILWKSSYVTVDGAADPAFQFQATSEITNNINLEVQGPVGAAPGLFGLVMVGTVAKWIDVHDFGSPLSGEGEGDGVHFVPERMGPTNSELGYCWIHENWGSGISTGRSHGYNGVSGLDIHHVLVERNHNNFLMGEGSYDLHDSILRDWRGPGVAHPDGIQGGIDNVRIWNNIISRSCPSGSMLYPDLNCSQANFCLVNNILFGDYTDISFAMDNAPAQLELTHVIIANNTFYGRNTLTFSVINHGRPSRRLRDWTIKNNLFYTGPGCSPQAAAFSTGGCEFEEAEVEFDHNLICGPSKSVNYRSSQYRSAEALSASTGYKRNLSSTPQLISPNQGDFHLQQRDAAAKGSGADLSDLSRFIPAISGDLEGATRPRGAAWDIGAYQCKPGETH